MRRRSRRREALVRVSVRGGPFAVSAAAVRLRAEKMLGALDLAAELSVALVDDPAIRELNRGYRGKDKPTDVLAFAMREGEGPADDLLGDVVISVPTAARQARKRGRPLLAEVTMLLAHGLLHLLGYDHAEPDEERVMKRKTAELEAAATTRARRARR